MAILIIEDDLQAAQLMRQALAQHGYVVEHAADGETGLRRAIEQNWELLIADRMLPGVDGLSIIRQVRDKGSRMPILILSALAEVDDRVRGLRAGGDDYLTKPYAFASCWRGWKCCCVVVSRWMPRRTSPMRMLRLICWRVPRSVPGVRCN